MIRVSPGFDGFEGPSPPGLPIVEITVHVSFQNEQK
jgi:hypothetical protein